MRALSIARLGQTARCHYGVNIVLYIVADRCAAALVFGFGPCAPRSAAHTGPNRFHRRFTLKSKPSELSPSVSQSVAAAVALTSAVSAAGGRLWPVSECARQAASDSGASTVSHMPARHMPPQSTLSKQERVQSSSKALQQVSRSAPRGSLCGTTQRLTLLRTGAPIALTSSMCSRTSRTT